CIAKMEYCLLAETKFSNGCAICGLVALAERRDAAPVFSSKNAVVDDEQSRPPKQRVRGCWPARQCIEPESASARVVGILQELFQNWVAGFVPILQIAFDLVDN